MKFKNKDKVINTYLGKGEIVKDYFEYCKGLWLVKFDKEPPYEYNLNQNPTVVFENDLKLDQN